MMTLTARLCAMCAVSALLQLALPDRRMSSTAPSVAAAPMPAPSRVMSRRSRRWIRSLFMRQYPSR